MAAALRPLGMKTLAVKKSGGVQSSATVLVSDN
jgi:hypothetical protein